MSSFNWKENMNGKGIDLPATFKCRICSKVKPGNNDHFSKKEIKTFQSRIAMGRPATGFSAGLRCRHCSGENVFELLCQYCQVTKGKDEFSYNQRTTPLVARCRACVNWSETNEPGTETLPGPSMALHPDSILAAASNPNPANALSAVNSSGHPGNDDGASSAWRTANPTNNTMSVPAGTSVRPTTKASVVQSGPRYAPQGFMPPTRLPRRGEDDMGAESSSPISAATDIFKKFDPFGHCGAKTGNANAALSDNVPASAYSEGTTDADAGDQWMTPRKKTAWASATHGVSGSGLDSFASPPVSHNTQTTGTRTMSMAYDTTGLPPTSPALGNIIPWASTNLQTVAPSVASSTRAAASVTASSAFEEGIASGKYGRPGHTTPRGNSSREWFKSTKPRREDTIDHGFETYAPADIATHAPPIRRPTNEDGESDDEW